MSQALEQRLGQAAEGARGHEQQHVAYDRLVTVFAEVFGLQISEGALVAAVARLGNKLAPAAAAIATEVRAAARDGS